MTKKTFDENALALNCPKVAEILESFVKDELNKAGFSKAVLGLSGGIDSAVSAAITVKALGESNVHCFMMPYKSSNPQSEKDALAVATNLNIETRKIDITPMVDAYFENYEPEADALRKGNVMARQRMITLYDMSQKLGALVIGTGNRTEIMLGYTTLYGDSACAINPMGDLWKTQVWQLAEYYSLPDQVVNKAPSADLWSGQTDEDELGFTYKHADIILTLLLDERVPPQEVVDDYGFSKDIVTRVMTQMRTNQFKRMMPPIAKISNRTTGLDFNYPRDWGM